ncbi:phosphoribosyltransferase [Emticicia oligotrophica DSM 17448]|uniref:Phosphoribosyltransferase n=1 Tax=Emticicia oligotrophica (strain DSM 17448 / CIP 109782 / MTCC 6937 / GPTSA100-15) TaxID=929562 RepID=A0ABM5N0Y8_EMTOG|nr:ComF family protein [Emticicia oligotrophica]AFK03075.1 phosphoribosyltransferase [Emticicia oligotrophica DSM 17448]
MKWFKHFLDIIYPRSCEACGEALLGGENLICTNCMVELPRTNSHILQIENISKRFWGKIPVDNAITFLNFSKKGRVQKLLHELKYRNKPEIGKYLGKLYGVDLKATEFNKKVDLIIGVPLHPSKFEQRGYNQADCIAEGLSEALDLPFRTDLVKRLTNTSTQTKKSRIERFYNVDRIFEVLAKEEIKGKRIAIVDDVLTTGATIESLGMILLEAEAKSISVITIAAAA